MELDDIIKPKIINIQNAIFYGPKDGLSEDNFKNEIKGILIKNKDIISGYLAILSYDQSKELSVGLCIRSLAKTDDIKFIKKIKKIFRRMFNANQYLDILFISKEQEFSLEKVCVPFYRKA